MYCAPRRVSATVVYLLSQKAQEKAQGKSAKSTRKINEKHKGKKHKKINEKHKKKNKKKQGKSAKNTRKINEKHKGKKSTRKSTKSTRKSTRKINEKHKKKAQGKQNETQPGSLCETHISHATHGLHYASCISLCSVYFPCRNV